MTPATKRVEFWAPRAAAVLFAAFVSVFALDVFDEGLGVWPTAGALLLHLIPSALILALLAIAWRSQSLGAMLYATLGVLVNLFPPRPLALSVRIVMSGPLFMIGGLFLIGRLTRSGSASARPVRRTRPLDQS